MSYWTEKIPVDWEMETLDKSVSNIIDNRGRTAPTAKSGIPLIATNCIKEFGLYPVFEKVRYIDQYTFDHWFRGHPEPNDILFVNKGTPGGVCIVPDPVPFCIAQDMVALRADPAKFDWKYLFAALRSEFVKSQIKALNVGTSIPHLKKTDFNRIIIPKPKLKIQRVIGELYYSLSRKIEINLQMNNTLEEMAMALYKHWFVDFGPFQNGEFIESELGEIPKGWEVKRLGDLFKIKHGFAFKGKYFQLEEREELLLTPGNFQSSGGIKFNWGKQKFYSADFPEDYILTKGDLIIALTDLTQSCDILGAPAIIPDTDYKYLHNQRLGLVTDLLPQFSNEFIYCIANSSNFRAFIRNSKTGSTVSHTSPTRIYDYKIALPPQGLEINFIEELENLLELTFTNSSENKTLTQLRDALLPKLISGEVRVKDVEKTLTEVL